MIPNTPGDRSPPDADASEQEVFLIYDNKQHGPFSITSVCALIRGQRIPTDALYWTQGMIGAQPISNLADDVEVTMPRKHHYAFAYIALPKAVFTIPKFVRRILEGDTQNQVAWAWTFAEQTFAKGDAVPSAGLSAEVFDFDREHAVLFVTLPTPRRNTEGYFAAAVIPRNGSAENIRYFVLSHSSGNEELGPSEGCIREITADGSNYRSKDFVEPFKKDFVAAIRDLCARPPEGAFYIRPPKF